MVMLISLGKITLFTMTESVAYIWRSTRAKVREKYGSDY